MACKIKFSTNNAAYRNYDDGSLNEESVATSLRKIADDIDNGFKSGVVMDYNGNKVGRWSIDED